MTLFDYAAAATGALLILGATISPARRHRLTHSPFAAHLKSAALSAFVPGCACVGLILALTYLQSLTPLTAVR